MRLFDGNSFPSDDQGPPWPDSFLAAINRGDLDDTFNILMNHVMFDCNDDESAARCCTTVVSAIASTASLANSHTAGQLLAALSAIMPELSADSKRSLADLMLSTLLVVKCEAALVWLADEFATIVTPLVAIDRIASIWPKLNPTQRLEIRSAILIGHREVSQEYVCEALNLDA